MSSKKNCPHWHTRYINQPPIRASWLSADWVAISDQEQWPSIEEKFDQAIKASACFMSSPSFRVKCKFHYSTSTALNVFLTAIGSLQISCKQCAVNCVNDVGRPIRHLLNDDLSIFDRIVFCQFFLNAWVIVFTDMHNGRLPMMSCLRAHKQFIIAERAVSIEFGKLF